jgi:hypothetical protein
MRDYIISVGSVMTLISFALMLIPEGGIKKFASMAAGFMIISTILQFPNEKIDFTGLNMEKIEADYSEAEAIYEAEVIKRHKENIKAAIEKEMKSGKCFVETDNNGNITRVTLRATEDESEALRYVVETLGVPRERVKVIYENQ